jgi:hypothetical protein
MTLKGLDELTIAHPPQLHRSVPRGGDHYRAIRAKIGTPDRI